MGYVCIVCDLMELAKVGRLLSHKPGSVVGLIRLNSLLVVCGYIYVRIYLGNNFLPVLMIIDHTP